MDSHSSASRRARLRLIIAAAVTGAAVVGIGVAVLSGVGSSDEAPSPPPSAAPSEPESDDSDEGSEMTPGRARQVQLPQPERQEAGLSRGFTDDAMGATSAAVHFQEEFAWLDDAQARRQMESITSPSSPETVTTAVSEVRRSREEIGLDPSGGLPAGLTVTTRVEAVIGRQIATNADDGPVVHVWLVYDRYATGPDAQPDQAPLVGQLTDFILSWEDGDWLLTEEQQYLDQRFHPVAYDADSPQAYEAGWMRVAHE
ncbi:hypothetical protein [Streptomyces sp. G-5]|uniref:hypothetical protein n=1 Tax=Streptomyces sp. G-5 TaxID=2977231 RepID=UPI0021CF8788|nr:hypothetical protein [Streptomyces sp. G-5]MCU4750300.1 hypothetical protein [Streptomyces sp. G-5]